MASWSDLGTTQNNRETASLCIIHIAGVYGEQGTMEVCKLSEKKGMTLFAKTPCGKKLDMQCSDHTFHDLLLTSRNRILNRCNLVTYPHVFVRIECYNKIDHGLI